MRQFHHFVPSDSSSTVCPAFSDQARLNLQVKHGRLTARRHRKSTTTVALLTAELFYRIRVTLAWSNLGLAKQGVGVPYCYSL